MPLFEFDWLQKRLRASPRQRPILRKFPTLTLISGLPVRLHPHNTITRSIRLDEFYTNIIILTWLERWNRARALLFFEFRRFFSTPSCSSIELLSSFFSVVLLVSNSTYTTFYGCSIISSSLPIFYSLKFRLFRLFSPDFLWYFFLLLSFLVCCSHIFFIFLLMSVKKGYYRVFHLKVFIIFSCLNLLTRPLTLNCFVFFRIFLNLLQSL